MLGNLIDNYLRIRNDLHLTSRTHTAGAKEANFSAQGAQGLQDFIPAQDLNMGQLDPVDLATVIGFINDTFDYHNPDATNRTPERAGQVAAQVLRTIFLSYPQQIIPGWRAQIEGEFETNFVHNYPSAAGWTARQQTDFNEAYNETLGM